MHSLLVTDVFVVCACLMYSLSCDKTRPCRLDIDLADPPSGPERLCVVCVRVCGQTGKHVHVFISISCCECLLLLRYVFKRTFKKTEKLSVALHLAVCEPCQRPLRNTTDRGLVNLNYTGI